MAESGFEPGTVCDPNAHVSPFPEVVFKGTLVYWASDLNPDLEAPPAAAHTAVLPSAWPWRRGQRDSAGTATH